MIITKDVNNKKDDIASICAEAEERNDDDDETDLHQEVLCQVSIWAI